MSGGKCAGNRGTEGSDFVWCDSAFKDRVPFPGCRNNDENWAVCPGDKVLTGIYRGGGGDQTYGVLKIKVVSGRDVRGKGNNCEGKGSRGECCGRHGSSGCEGVAVQTTAWEQSAQVAPRLLLA